VLQLNHCIDYRQDDVSKRVDLPLSVEQAVPENGSIATQCFVKRIPLKSMINTQQLIPDIAC
jgi:hypothetical protein